MEETLKALKLELLRAKDPKIQKDLRYAIHFLMKAIAQHKVNLKKEQKNLQKEAREVEAAKAELLREIRVRRKTLQRKLS
jgi:hypothetical protein